tara:strand:- start:73 stop:603 length:531 start_codon:yes stop_codon:yes gene_type:complete
MMFPKGSFRSDVTNKQLTKGLFYESSYENTANVIFTLKPDDIEVRGHTYVSLNKLYVSLCAADPTEYTFSQVVFSSWDIWDTLRRSPYLKNEVARWRREVEVRIKSEAIRAIADEMKTGGRSSFSAAKLLLDRGWLDSDTASAAKSKLQKKEEDDLNKEAMSQLSDDAERLGLKIN